MVKSKTNLRRTFRRQSRSWGAQQDLATILPQYALTLPFTQLALANYAG
jgi:hypothetical protein